MKLDLNNKEWIALYGLLERRGSDDDKHLNEVHLRMRSIISNALCCSERNQFEDWFKNTQIKVERLKKEPIGDEVLTDSDDEFHVDVAYPKRSKNKKPRS